MNNRKNFTKAALICTCLIGAQSIMAYDAQARDFNRAKSASIGDRSATKATTGNRTRGEGFQREKTITTESGKTATRSASGSYDKETKTYNRSSTGYNGKEHSSSTTYDHENKTLTTQGANGGSRTTSYTEGQKTSTYTGTDGNTGSRTTTYDRENKTKTSVNSNGGSRTVGYSDDGTRTTTHTGAEGKTNSRTTAYDAETQTATTTNSRGGTSTTTYNDGTSTKTITTKNGRSATIVRDYNIND